MEKVAGVDMGFSGAIAIIGTDKTIIDLIDMPTIATDKKELDEHKIKNIFLEHKVKHAFLEKAQTMPNQGISSSGRYMMAYGIIRGICVGLGIPYTLVRPQTWKKEMMPDMGKDKKASIIRAQQLYPTIDLPKAKDHGKADALLIALYGINRY